MDEPLVVWLVLYGDVVILRHGGGIKEIYFQQTVQRHERQIQYLVVAIGKALYQVYPYYQVCIDEKIGTAEILIDGKKYAQVDLVADRTIEKQNSIFDEFGRCMEKYIKMYLR